MGYTIPIEIYEKFEEKLGKETASAVVKALEMSIKEAIKEGKRDLKNEINDEKRTRYEICHRVGKKRYRYSAAGNCIKNSLLSGGI